MAYPSNVVNILSPTIPIDQSIYEDSSVQKARLGTRLEVGDRVFHYARLATSASATAGIVLHHPLMIDSHTSALVQCSAATTGATRLQLTVGSAIVTNAYAEGYISKATGVGQGWMFRIKSHDVMASGAATGYVNLYDAIPGTIASGEVDLVPCLWASVQILSDVLAAPAGVTPTSVTTGYYFWLQTWGPTAALMEGNPAAGSMVRCDTGGDVDSVTVNATAAAGVELQSMIGRKGNIIGTDNQNNPVFLTIWP